MAAKRGRPAHVRVFESPKLSVVRDTSNPVRPEELASALRTLVRWAIRAWNRQNRQKGAPQDAQ